jgi:DNA mismatch endonuclease (patch repair protein)
MRSVKAFGNKSTERRFRAALVSRGISGWVVNPRNVTGRPDFFFPMEKVALYIDGCFWHGCAKCGHIPKNNRDFWRTKIIGNRLRDRRTTRSVQSEGITVVRFWEHEVKDNIRNCLDRLENFIALEPSDVYSRRTAG